MIILVAVGLLLSVQQLRYRRFGLRTLALPTVFAVVLWYSYVRGAAASPTTPRTAAPRRCAKFCMDHGISGQAPIVAPLMLMVILARLGYSSSRSESLRTLFARS